MVFGVLQLDQITIDPAIGKLKTMRSAAKIKGNKLAAVLGTTEI
jgi:hypothetical protein